LVINRVKVLVSGPHTPTQLFWEYPWELRGLFTDSGLPWPCKKAKEKMAFPVGRFGRKENLEVLEKSDFLCPSKKSEDLRLVRPSSNVELHMR